MVTNFGKNGLSFLSPNSIQNLYSPSHPHGMINGSNSIQFRSPNPMENPADYTSLWNPTVAPSSSATFPEMTYDRQIQPQTQNMTLKFSQDNPRRSRLIGMKRKGLDDSGGPSLKVFVDEEKMAAGLQGLQLQAQSNVTLENKATESWFTESVQPMEAAVIDEDTMNTKEILKAAAAGQAKQLEVCRDVWESMNYKNFVQRLTSEEIRKSSLALVPYTPPREVLTIACKDRQTEEENDEQSKEETKNVVRVPLLNLQDDIMVDFRTQNVATMPLANLQEDVMVDLNCNNVPIPNFLENWTVIDTDMYDMEL